MAYFCKSSVWRPGDISAVLLSFVGYCLIGYAYYRTQINRNIGVRRYSHHALPDVPSSSTLTFTWTTVCLCVRGIKGQRRAGSSHAHAEHGSDRDQACHLFEQDHPARLESRGREGERFNRNSEHEVGYCANSGVNGHRDDGRDQERDRRVCAAVERSDRSWRAGNKDSSRSASNVSHCFLCLTRLSLAHLHTSCLALTVELFARLPLLDHCPSDVEL